MGQLSVFQGFDLQQLTLLRPLFTYFFMPSGSVLFDQGQEADCLYILIEGEVAIRYKPEDGPSIVVAHVRPEAVIGWSAAIGSPHYSSSAACTIDSKILRVRSVMLRELYHSDPHTGVMLLERLGTMIEARLRSNHPQLMALLEQGLSIKLDQLAPAV